MLGQNWRGFARALAFTGGLFAASPVFAWSPPSVGVPCHSARHGRDTVVIAGNYLGGRPMRAGMVDWKSFQACFRDVVSCENWLGRRAVAYPLRPGFARCTPIVVAR
jgi:hypothetical protein